MKRYLRYIILAVLLVCVVSLASCGDDRAADGTNTDSTQTEQPSESQETVKHKLHDYFVLENEAEAISFSNITQYEGEIIARDASHGLLALETKDLNTENYVEKTVTIYDLAKGEVIYSRSTSYALGDEEPELSVVFDYPVMKVISSSYVDYYLAKQGGEMLGSIAVEKENTQKISFDNGLVAIRLADKVYWIDRDLEIIRSVDQIAASGYIGEVTTDSFQSEFEGYLYSLGEKKVQVFNRLGICSGEYQIAHDGYLSAYVLNNGNVLIQEFEPVKVYEDYDVAFFSEMLDRYYTVTSYVMNMLDGSMTELALDFIVDELETAYAQENDAYSDLPFKLADGKQNQAIIYRFADGNLSVYQEYVVLGNDLTVEYTVQNTRRGVNFYYASVIQADLYAAEVHEGGDVQEYLFDLNGNALAPFTDEFVASKSYIITESGVYNHKMEKILDLVSGEYEVVWDAWESMGILIDDSVYLTKHNYQTHADEIYVLTAASATPTLLCDGKDVTVTAYGPGYYVLHDQKTDQYSFCNLAGEVKMVVWGWHNIWQLEDGLLVETDFEGRTVTFIVH